MKNKVNKYQKDTVDKYQNVEYTILDIGRFLIKKINKVIEIYIDKYTKDVKISSLQTWDDQAKNINAVKNNIDIKNIWDEILRKKCAYKAIIEHLNTG